MNEGVNVRVFTVSDGQTAALIAVVCEPGSSFSSAESCREAGPGPRPGRVLLPAQVGQNADSELQVPSESVYIQQ